MGRDLVLFDFDSTVVSVESLDFAAKHALAGAADEAERLAQIEAITAKGMEGTIPLEQSIAERFKLIGLTRHIVEEVAEVVRTRITNGFHDLFSDLRAAEWDIAIISGGFRALIDPAADELDVAPHMRFTNEFIYDGLKVIGADMERPLTRNGGKAIVAREVRANLSDGGRLVMVGDGLTDFEAYDAGAADDFIGFGLHAERAAVRARAPKYAMTVEELRGFLLEGAA